MRGRVYAPPFSRVLMCLFIPALLSAACDDETKPPEQGDVSPDETTEPCDYYGILTILQRFQTDQQNASYRAGSNSGEMLLIEFYDGHAVTGPGSYPIAATPAEQNYSSCTLCVLAGRDCVGSSCQRYFLATEGSLVVESWLEAERFVARLDDVRMQEVSIDWAGDSSSTLVEGGEEWCLEGLEVQAATRCSSAGDCFPEAPVCHPQTAQCVECASSSDCAAPLPVCESVRSRCVQCVTAEDCQAGQLCTDTACVDP
ncbi:MAG: hypothetical protein RBU37_06565 [Myxococcota bacterium]|nr:hypothetical protein [Myxococcota bacterium]